MTGGHDRQRVLWRLHPEQLLAYWRQYQSSSRSGGALSDKLDNVAQKQRLPEAIKGHYRESEWFVSGGNQLASLFRQTETRDASLQLYDTRTFTGKRILKVPLPVEAYVHGVASDQKTLAFLSGEPRRLHVWDVQSETQLRDQALNRPPTALALSPDGTHLAIACVSKSVSTSSRDTSVPVESVIEIRDVATGEEQAEFTATSGMITSLEYSADGRRIISGGSDTTVLVWELSASARSPSVQ